MLDITKLSLDEFLELPTRQVAEMIKGLTLGFPIDGTRRWFFLQQSVGCDVEGYKEKTARQFVEQFTMLFEHGVETILIPVCGGELLSRGEEYVRDMMEGLAWLVQHQIFKDFYREYNVRVRFYGDWRRQVEGLPGADNLVNALGHYSALQYTGPRRIFYGVWADDMLVSIVDDLARSKSEPVEFTREAIVSRYYGEYVRPTDIYIGFGRPTVFDVPMLVSSRTDLYYTVLPSLDVDTRLFRMIVWDHFRGRWTQQQWDGLNEKDLDALRAFYAAHHDHILGLGNVDKATGIWYPMGLRPIDSFREKNLNPNKSKSMVL